MVRFWFIFFWMMTSVSCLLAHPGHGNPQNVHSLTHYVTEPIHVVGGMVILLMVILLMRFFQHGVPGNRSRNVEG